MDKGGDTSPPNQFLARLRGLGGANAVQLPLAVIHPRPNRSGYRPNPKQLEALAQLIREAGFIKPLLVHRQPNGRYTLIAGEHYLHAAKMAGLESAPAYVFEGEEGQIRGAALIEIMYRADLNPYERAEEILAYLEGELSMGRDELLTRVRTMANAMRKGRLDHKTLTDESGQVILRLFDTIGYSLRTFAEKDVVIFRLPPDTLEPLRSGAVPYRTATIIARAPEELRPELVAMALEGKSESEIRAAVTRARKKAPVPTKQYAKRLRRAARALTKVGEVPSGAERLIDKLEKALGLR